MLVVNLFGGPGSGKSTTAAGVFHVLKTRGINAELVTEYAKDLTWERRHHALANQPLILGKQFHRLWRIHEQVEVAITDSPIFLGIVYNQDKLEHLPSLIMELHDMFQSVNYFIRRKNDHFTNVGRNHSLDESIHIDDEIERYLHKYGVEFEDIERDEALEHIVNDLITRGVGAIKC